MSDTERVDLVRALTEANAADEPLPILARPSPEFLKTAKAGIEACPSFKAVEKKHVYSANSLIPMHSEYLASIVYYHGETGEEQADWLLRMMRTKVADGYLVAAIWGIELTETVQVSATARIIPFDHLPDFAVKRRLIERAERRKNSWHWSASNAYQVPVAAYVEDIKDVPYISSDARADNMFTEAISRALRVWPLVEMLGAGRPLVFASWFEYVDASLDVASFENQVFFYHAEVTPYMFRPVRLDAERLRADLVDFALLPQAVRERLIRAAKRFSLSQCRSQTIDRTLDLAVAFETMLTGRGENNFGIGWKLAVRCAQLIGGELAERLNIRDQFNVFYNLRSRASHGDEANITVEDVNAATELFARAFRALIRLGREAAWKEIEMVPPTPDHERLVDDQVLIGA